MVELAVRIRRGCPRALEFGIETSVTQAAYTNIKYLKFI
jgi:hypothetical protein